MGIHHREEAPTEVVQVEDHGVLVEVATALLEVPGAVQVAFRLLLVAPLIEINMADHRIAIPVEAPKTIENHTDQ